MLCCALGALVMGQVVFAVSQILAFLGFTQTRACAGVCEDPVVQRGIAQAGIAAAGGFVVLAGLYLTFPPTFGTAVDVICTAQGMKFVWGG